jgi:hypothetical protein
MILPDFILPTRQNAYWLTSGIDSLELCANKRHYNNYPYFVEYNYNSRGFRDAEWPSTMAELKQSIWCLGDSCTVGIGSPIEHTWTHILQKQTNTRCINISLGAASNSWISRKSLRILDIIKPKIMVIHWAFPHRFEDPDVQLLDEDRRCIDRDMPDIDQIIKLTNDILLIEKVKGDCHVVHTFVPGLTYLLTPPSSFLHRMWDTYKGDSWTQTPPTTLTEFNALNDITKTDLRKLTLLDSVTFKSSPEKYNLLNLLDSISTVPIFQKLDLARDGCHYDILTATKFVEDIMKLIKS